MIKFEFLDPRMTPEHLGLLPDFFSEEDPASAAEQLNINYAHGGGYTPFGDGTWILFPDLSLKYPGDPVLKPLAKAELHEETLVFYSGAILAIIQPDGTFKVTRVD